MILKQINVFKLFTSLFFLACSSSSEIASALGKSDLIMGGGYTQYSAFGDTGPNYTGYNASATLLFPIIRLSKADIVLGPSGKYVVDGRTVTNASTGIQTVQKESGWLGGGELGLRFMPKPFLTIYTTAAYNFGLHANATLQLSNGAGSFIQDQTISIPVTNYSDIGGYLRTAINLGNHVKIGAGGYFGRAQQMFGAYDVVLTIPGLGNISSTQGAQTTTYTVMDANGFIVIAF